MLADDIACNKAIGRNGSDAILKCSKTKTNLRVLTHCNTGVFFRVFRYGLDPLKPHKSIRTHKHT